MIHKSQVRNLISKKGIMKEETFQGDTATTPFMRTLFVQLVVYISKITTEHRNYSHDTVRSNTFSVAAITRINFTNSNVKNKKTCFWVTKMKTKWWGKKDRPAPPSVKLWYKNKKKTQIVYDSNARNPLKSGPSFQVPNGPNRFNKAVPPLS